jgi:hypothetical protein
MLPNFTNNGAAFGGYVEKAVICRTPGYQVMQRRPYGMNVSGNTSQIIGQMSNGIDYSKERLAPIASSIILPATAAESAAMIPNAWTDERCMFILKIVHATSSSGMKTVQYLTGYTDRQGMQPSFNDINIDPDMQLYFNMSMTYNESTILNGYGQKVTQIVPINASQLVMGNSGGVYGMNDRTMRPEDVFSTINSSILVQQASQYDNGTGQMSNSQQMYDGRVSFQPGQPYKLSNMANLIPSNYLSRVLESSATEAMIYADAAGGRPNPADTSSSIASQLNDGYLNNDLTLDMIMNRSGLQENRWISWRDLCNLLPNILQPGVLHKAGTEGIQTGQVQGAVGGAGSEHMMSGNYETVIANMLNNVFNALMMDMLMGDIQMNGNNMTATSHTMGMVSGNFDLKVPWATSFVDGRDAQQMSESFKIRLVREFLSGFTGHNHVPIVFNVSASLMAENVIDISYNNGPLIRYVFPCFASSSFTPILTGNTNQLNEIARHTKTLVGQLTNII